eukprot:jgi/Mesvir1/929/Mv17487-RA.1
MSFPSVALERHDQKRADRQATLSLSRHSPTSQGLHHSPHPGQSLAIPGPVGNLPPQPASSPSILAPAPQSLQELISHAANVLARCMAGGQHKHHDGESAGQGDNHGHTTASQGSPLKGHGLLGPSVRKVSKRAHRGDCVGADSRQDCRGKDTENSTNVLTVAVANTKNHRATSNDCKDGGWFSASATAPLVLARVASTSLALSSASDRAAASSASWVMGAAHPPACAPPASDLENTMPGGSSSHSFDSGVPKGKRGLSWGIHHHGGQRGRVIAEEGEEGDDVAAGSGRAGVSASHEGREFSSSMSMSSSSSPTVSSSSSKGQGKGLLPFLGSGGSRAGGHCGGPVAVFGDLASVTMAAFGDLASVTTAARGPPPPASAAAVRNKALVGAIAGGVAGAFTSAVLHPIDTIKTRLQVRGANKVYKHATDVMMQSVKQTGGLADLYRGLQAAVLGAGPSSALYFGTYELTKSALYQHLPPQLTAMVPPVAATLGNMVSSIILVPKELIKQRLQVGSADSALKVLLATVRTEGIGGLYVGYGPTLLRNLPSNVINFTVFEWLKALALSTTGRTSLPSWENFALGAISGASSAALTTPLDVVKTRLMTQVSPELIAATGGSKANAAAAAMAQGGYRGMIDTLRAIAKEEGFAGLTRGMPPRLLYSALFGAVGFFAFENCKAVIYKRQEQAARASAQRAKEKEAKAKAQAAAAAAAADADASGGALASPAAAAAKGSLPAAPVGAANTNAKVVSK